MPEFQDFAWELKHLVFQQCTKECQKALRLVSKEFSALVTPLLFESIAIPTDWVQPFPVIIRHVRTLTLEVVDYEELDDEVKWANELQNRADGLNYPPNSLYSDVSHRAQAYNVYTGCREALQTNTTRCMTLLAGCLQNMSNLGHIYITDAVYEIRTHPYANRHCRLPECLFPREDHTILALAPISGLQTLAMKVLNGVTLELSRLNIRLPSLTIMSPFDERDSGFHYNILSSEPARDITQRPHFVNVLSTLTTLALELRYDDCLERTFAGRYEACKVSRLLCRVPNLQRLDLAMEPDYGNTEGSFPDFCTVLNQCVFAQLTFLRLVGFQSTGNELLAFTDESPKLVKLNIGSHDLLVGTWEAILEYWRAYLPHLEHVQLHNIFEGLGSNPNTAKKFCSWPRSIYHQNESTVRAYWEGQDQVQAFLAGGVNPFRR